MAELTLTAAQVRRIAINAQLLDGRGKLARGADGAMQQLERLGYVQLDTISVIERAHHHTLWARVPGYAPAMLDELVTARRAFEYWGHAASVLPMADYRFCLPLMRRHREQPSGWTGEMRDKHAVAMRAVLKRIRADGALKSADFESPKGSNSAWWGWKPDKAALELLMWEGELMVSARDGFQRVYDLTERVLPPGTDTREPDAAELGRFAVRRALAAHGVAREKDIVDHLSLARRPVTQAALREMLSGGEVAAVRIPGDSFQYYALVEALPGLLKLRAVKPRLHILSPFDNFTILRDRLRRLFGFEYSLECYTPPPKRRYGYFTLPVLWGETLAGRLDAKAERKAGVLDVRGLWLEDGFSPDDEFCAALAAKLRAFARFNGCPDARLSALLPRQLKSKLQRLLRQEG